MPTDPNHRALLKAVGQLTTQVRRIADTLETPVATDDDGAQTTDDDTRRCVCGDPLQWYTAPGGASGWIHDPTPGKPVLDVHTPRPADSPAPATCGAKKQRTIRRQQFRLLLNQLNAGVTPLTTGQVQALTAYVADEIVECNMETQEADRLEGDVKLLRAELDRIYTPRTISTMGRASLTIGEQLAMAANLEKITAALDRVRAIKLSPPRSEFNARTNAQDEGWDQALAAVRAALIGPLAEG
ncbi:hypothetical protein [Streptomyces cyaneofuscatus]|uniref:hypothetical protein n=1 Tax=Streptomyces cyaneofuscatus TaxID=66883 RepID=UPI00331EEC92